MGQVGVPRSYILRQVTISYRVINRRLVESLARSLDLPINESFTNARELGVSQIVGAKWTRSRGGQPLGSDDPRLIPQIAEALRNSGQLRIERPDTAEEFWQGDHEGWYVYESLVATPVILPLKNKFPEGVTSPDAVTVWVSDPRPPTIPRQEWDFSTSFLFLVEELGEFKWPMGWFMSGISSLRIVAEFLTEPRDLSYEALFEVRGAGDRFGRWQTDHPVMRLQEIGGVVGSSRRIESVYKVAYMTDEQSYSVNDETYRVSDILAYPLYIAD